MNKNEVTAIKLEQALERILRSETLRIPSSRKLSVRAVEEEAGLGNGSCYYYSEIVTKIKQAKLDSGNPNSEKFTATKSDIQKIRTTRDKEKRIKIKYKEENNALKERLEQMASEHHRFAYALRQAQSRILELEQRLEQTKAELIESRREKITPIKS
ncbi:hypothetical protein AB4277_13205 [Vibrio splendidus]